MTHLQKKNNSNPLVPFQVIIIGGFILTGIFLTYRNALDNFFTGDDFPWIYHVIKMRYHFVDGLLERYTWMGSTILFYLNLLISGTDVWGYNLTNLLIHLGNVIFVGLLGYFLTKDKLVGLLAMLLWGINAQGSEVILWKTGRGHSLVLFFMLGALIFFAAWDQKKNNWLYVSALLFAACAHLTLFNATILPGIICAYLLIFKGVPRKFQHVIDYIKILSPFMLITGIYLLFYFFVLTTLSSSAYHNFEGSLPIRFGQYVFNYFIFFPEYFFRITYNERLLPYLGVMTFLAVFSALIFINNKILRFSLIWIVLTMLLYLPVIGTGNYQPSRYRYIPLVGCCLLLSDLLLRLKNKTFSSNVKRRGTMLVEMLFIVIFVVGNIYYIVQDEMDYDYYGKVHQMLVNKAQDFSRQLPLDKTIVFVNLSDSNIPALAVEKMIMPKLFYVRPTAPWKLVYIQDLLTFCAYADNKEGFFVIQNKKMASQNILNNTYKALAFSNEDFYFPKLDSKQIEQVLRELGDHNLQSRVTALQYAGNP
jgi:hypothetical protein